MAEKNLKRILLVDDEEQVIFVVSESLGKLGAEAEIVTAANGQEALERVKESFFDLVITDLKMPKMNGIRLTEAIREISPETQVIWMTAFGNKETKAQAESLSVSHFLAKPLDIADIRKIAQEALQNTAERRAKENVPQLSDSDGIKERIDQLKKDVSAFAVLLITTAGNIVETTGLTKELNADTLAALIAGNFLASNEIAQMLGRESNFRLSYHESDQHNIYSYGVGKRFLLVTVFGREIKPGVVWFYAQRAATDLADLLEKADIDDSIDNSLDKLFTEEVQGELSNILESLWETGDPKSKLEKTAKTQTAKEKNAKEQPSAFVDVETMSYAEAVAQGLIPGNISE